MKCPVCKKENFNIREIEKDLNAEFCRECDGKWISSENYEKWLEQHGDTLPELPSKEENDMSIPDFELARLCPQCRRILVKYKVGHGTSFKVDRCGSCAGVWLDANEWDALKSRNLHDELHKVFTDHWQEEVSREETRKALEKIYKEKFGEDDYEKIKSFKLWVNQHKKSSEILAFIKDKNPFQF